MKPEWNKRSLQQSLVEEFLGYNPRNHHGSQAWPGSEHVARPAPLDIRAVGKCSTPKVGVGHRDEIDHASNRHITRKENNMPSFSLVYHGYYGEKPWVARITGNNKQYGLEREFIHGVRERSKSGKTSTTTVSLEEGLYEAGGGKSHIRDLGRFFVIWADKEGGLKRSRIEPTRALKIAEMLDSGTDFNTARLATMPEA